MAKESNKVFTYGINRPVMPNLKGTFQENLKRRPI